ncbi:unnamed protein product, partial [Tenebrio molitor]
QVIPKLQRIRYLDVTDHQDVKETIRGRIRGCDPKTLYATLYPARFHQNSACERRMIRRIFRMPDRFPSDNLYQETNTIQIQSRFKQLQRRYVSRTLPIHKS